MNQLPKEQQKIVQDMNHFLNEYSEIQVHYEGSNMNFSTFINYLLLSKTFLNDLPVKAKEIFKDDSKRGQFINCLMYFRYTAPSELLKEMFGIDRGEAYPEDKQSPYR